MSKSTAQAMAAALEMFESQGVKVTKEMRDALKTAQQTEMFDAAKAVFDRKCLSIENVDATIWVERSFELAERIENQIAGENVGRGRGMVFERVFRVETPSGTLKVSLTTEPTE